MITVRTYFAFILFCFTFHTANTFATKARLEALGENSKGSRFIKDDRNILINPNRIFEIGNIAVAEMGSDSSDTDSQVAPKAEGGIFFKEKRYGYGVYIGNESDTQITFLNESNTSLLHPDNQIELFFALNTKTKIGGSVSYYSNYEDSATNDSKKSNGIGLKLAVLKDNFSIDAKAYFNEKSEFGSSIFDTKNNFEVGGHFNLFNLVLTADSSFFKANYTSGATNYEFINNKVKFMIRKIINNPYGSTFLSLGYNYEMNKKNKSTLEKLTYTNIPMIFAFESKAKEWLTLRGSLSFKLLGNIKTETTTTTDASEANTTDVILGASLNYKRTTIDGLIGNSLTGNQSSETGLINTDNLFTRLAVSFKF